MNTAARYPCLQGKRVFIRRVFARFGEGEGWPDGPVVDSAGALWTGLFAGHEVRRYAPDGRLLR